MKRTSAVRPPDQRPGSRHVIGRIVPVSGSTALALWSLDDFDIARPRAALLAGVIVGLLNGVVGLKSSLAEVGRPVTLPWLDAGRDPARPGQSLS